MVLGSLLPMGLEGGDRSLRRELKLTADRVPHRGRDPFIWNKDATHGILEKLTHGLPQTPPRIRVVRTPGTIREQPGEETIPNDPKRS